MPTIRFQTNVPVEVRLRSTEGRPVESQFGGVQTMFSAEEGVFYVSEVVGSILAEQFQKLGVKAGEPVGITKAEISRGNGRKGIQWTVTKSVQAGEQPDGTLAVPKTESGELERTLAESIARIEARKQAVAPAPAWTDSLVAQSNALIDAYSQVLTHASKYANVRGEDVRSIFLSTFINVTKSNGGRNAA
jgi:hypothetical protein